MFFIFLYIYTKTKNIKQKKNKLHGLSPRANYSDRRLLAK
jgi:hypothetical protein